MDMPWYSVCSFFFFFVVVFFLFRSNVKKEYLNENNFCYRYGNFFGKCYSESYLITAMLNFLLNNYETHWQQYFEGYPTVEDFMDMDQETC